MSVDSTAAPAGATGFTTTDNDAAAAFVQSQLDKAACTHERLMLLIETIIEKQRVAMDEMTAGKARDREFYGVWCLLQLAHDNMKAFDKDLERIQGGGATEGVAA